MKRSFTRPAFFLCIFLVQVNVFGQSKYPLKIAVLNEATAIPFNSFFNKPIHPGILFGTELKYKEKEHFRLYQSINVGYIWHRWLYHGFFINTELGYDYKLNWGINLKSQLGIGYMHNFSTQKEYRFSAGRYKASADRGNSRLTSSLALGLGYRFHKKDIYSPEAFVLYQGWVEYPYSPGFIPIMPHLNIQAGAKFYLPKK
ncbi:MAG: hypothetical protein WAT19_04475 [Ferruginibacter sp.]